MRGGLLLAWAGVEERFSLGMMEVGLGSRGRMDTREVLGLEEDLATMLSLLTRIRKIEGAES